MIDTEFLKGLLKNIEEPKNVGTVMFKALIRTCIIASITTDLLYENGEIGENEKFHIKTRVELARKNIIKTQKEVIIENFKYYDVKDIDTLINALFEMIVC